MTTEAKIEIGPETQARLRQALEEYDRAASSFDLKANTPHEVAVISLVMTSRTYEAVLLSELARLDPGRAEEVTRWLSACVLDDGEVGDEWMSRRLEEAKAGLPLSPIPGAAPAPVDWPRVQAFIEQELELAHNGEGYEPGAVAKAIVNRARYGNEDGPAEPSS